MRHADPNTAPAPERDAELRQCIKDGVAALDRGEYTEIDDEHCDLFLDSLAEEFDVNGVAWR